MKPEISVVIATWQRTHLLNRCLKALVEQDIDDNRYEIIIVTDGPDHEELAKYVFGQCDGKLFFIAR